MNFLKSLLLQITVAILGFYVVSYFLDEVVIKEIEYLFYAGITLGLINCFLRPVIKIATFPLRILTLGLFTFFVNIVIIWFVAAIFEEISIEGFVALLITTLVLSVLEAIAFLTVK